MKSIFKVTFFIAVMASLFGCNQQQYPDPCAELDAVDLEMLKLIEEIEKRYLQEKDFLREFREAQVYWIQYKDRHVKSLFPKKQKFYKEKFGMSYNYCKCKEWTRLTRLRIAELKPWLEGAPEGLEDCPTSIKTIK